VATGTGVREEAADRCACPVAGPCNARHVVEAEASSKLFTPAREGAGGKPEKFKFPRARLCEVSLSDSNKYLCAMQFAVPKNPFLLIRGAETVIYGRVIERARVR